MSHTGDVTQDTQDFDVVIIGAGISGIDAAYRIAERNPGIRYVVLERRSRIGGTWDLFRYPGVRSDSSIFGLSYPFEPWTRDEGVADGDHIREYLEDTAAKHGIADHIRFDTLVRGADWDSTTHTWTVRTDYGTTFRSGYVFFATGYYSYDEPYTPEFGGIEQFGGDVIHPQSWPEAYDYAGKTLVVIGSGATAISMIPALAEKAKVVMLQRTPSYIGAADRIRPLDAFLRDKLPRKASHRAMRMRYCSEEALNWFLSRKAPGFMKWNLRKRLSERLPDGFPLDPHFNPPYNPWDQRPCLDADGDLLQAISDGRVEMVTDRIDRVDATGIALTSGRHIDADVIVTATGLQLQALGGVAVSIDGAEIKTPDRFVYKARMLEDVPNLFWCVGYTNASWTLRADITARAAAKLIAYNRSHGYLSAYPHRDGDPMPERPAWDIQAGYVMRNLHALPKSGDKRPWKVRHNYFADAIDDSLDRITESMVFNRAS